MSYGLSERKPLLNFSDTLERATLVDLDSDSESMPPKRRSRKRKGAKRGPRKGLKGVRVTKGKISLKIRGYSGIQKLGASELIHYIPLSKLKVAAKKVLRRSGAKKTKKRRKGKGKRKGRQSTSF
jgi:hypothetical protein